MGDKGPERGTVKTIEWVDGRVRLIDQTKLPLSEEFIECRDYECVAEAIKNLRIRGAPAIGVAAALGMLLGVLDFQAKTGEELLKRVHQVAADLAATRPTAVNLPWALERMKERAASAGRKPEEIKKALEQEALAILAEDEDINRRLSAFGAALIETGDRLMTHCNAGALATAAYGTALGVVRAAVEEGKQVTVYSCETRPLLQGSRLTAWEMMKEGIPVTLITDSMAGSVMRAGRVDKVIVGADRIAANGDTANKIGTYSLAVLAASHKLPFYVAAPTSTVDLSIESGDQIPIEERDPSEVTFCLDQPIAPPGVSVFNPAFDVTPVGLISGIITEKGIAAQPFVGKFLKKLSAGGSQ